MSRVNALLIAGALAAGFATLGTAPAHAAATPLDDCVDLDAGSDIRRFGSQFLVVKSGDEHYRVSFRGSCSDIATSTSFAIQTENQANRLCPSGSRVQLRKGSCAVGRVESISDEDYRRYSRR